MRIINGTCARQATCEISAGRRGCFCTNGYSGDGWSSCTKENDRHEHISSTAPTSSFNKRAFKQRKLNKQRKEKKQRNKKKTMKMNSENIEGIAVVQTIQNELSTRGVPLEVNDATTQGSELVQRRKRNHKPHTKLQKPVKEKKKKRKNKNTKDGQEVVKKKKQKVHRKKELRKMKNTSFDAIDMYSTSAPILTTSGNSEEVYNADDGEIETKRQRDKSRVRNKPRKRNGRKGVNEFDNNEDDLIDITTTSSIANKPMRRNRRRDKHRFLGKDVIVPVTSENIENENIEKYVSESYITEDPDESDFESKDGEYVDGVTKVIRKSTLKNDGKQKRKGRKGERDLTRSNDKRRRKGRKSILVNEKMPEVHEKEYTTPVSRETTIGYDEEMYSQSDSKTGTNQKYNDQPLDKSEMKPDTKRNGDRGETKTADDKEDVSYVTTVGGDIFDKNSDRVTRRNDGTTPVFDDKIRNTKIKTGKIRRKDIRKTKERKSKSETESVFGQHFTAISPITSRNTEEPGQNTNDIKDIMTADEKSLPGEESLGYDNVDNEIEIGYSTKATGKDMNGITDMIDAITMQVDDKKKRHESKVERGLKRLKRKREKKGRKHNSVTEMAEDYEIGHSTLSPIETTGNNEEIYTNSYSGTFTKRDNKKLRSKKREMKPNRTRKGKKGLENATNGLLSNETKPNGQSSPSKRNNSITEQDEMQDDEANFDVDSNVYSTVASFVFDANEDDDQNDDDNDDGDGDDDGDLNVKLEGDPSTDQPDEFYITTGLKREVESKLGLLEENDSLEDRHVTSLQFTTPFNDKEDIYTPIENGLITDNEDLTYVKNEDKMQKNKKLKILRKHRPKVNIPTKDPETDRQRRRKLRKQKKKNDQTNSPHIIAKDRSVTMAIEENTSNDIDPSGDAEIMTTENGNYFTTIPNEQETNKDLYALDYYDLEDDPDVDELQSTPAIANPTLSNTKGHDDKNRSAIITYDLHESHTTSVIQKAENRYSKAHNGHTTVQKVIKPLNDTYSYDSYDTGDIIDDGMQQTTAASRRPFKRENPKQTMGIQSVAPTDKPLTVSLSDDALDLYTTTATRKNIKEHKEDKRNKRRKVKSKNNISPAPIETNEAQRANDTNENNVILSQITVVAIRTRKNRTRNSKQWERKKKLSKKKDIALSMEKDSQYRPVSSSPTDPHGINRILNGSALIQTDEGAEEKTTDASNKAPTKQGLAVSKDVSEDKRSTHEEYATTSPTSSEGNGNC